ncbi:MAG: LysR family transcriptional regulator [Bacteriovoracaceae bacterium]
MERFSSELSLLSRAIVYPNLSTASVQIGVSQPQLSRVIMKLEAELKVVLLERQSRRHSSWTAMAYRLAEMFSELSSKFDSRLKEIIDGEEPEHIRIGTLEGLLGFGVRLSENLFSKLSIKMVHLDVYDRDQLDEHFLKGQLDIIFTSDQLIRRKFKYEQSLGHQVMEQVKTNPNYLVQSSFEHATMGKKKSKEAGHILISNSLQVRKCFLQEVGGIGVIASSTFVKSAKSGVTNEVILLAHESLSQTLWEKIRKIKLSP